MHRADVLRDLAYQNTVTGKAPAQPADNPYGYDWSMLEAAQESLREHMARIKELEAQLAQPAQEPVAWMQADHEHISLWEDVYHTIPLYTKPPQREWVGLTEKDFSAINQSCLTKLQAATSAESILKEKNS
jgi:hypothetical protein